MKIIDKLISKLYNKVYSKFERPGGGLLPREGLLGLWEYKDGILQESVGLLSSSYALLDAYWQSVLFDDPETPKSSADIYSTVVADLVTNTPGGQVYYSEYRSLVAIYSTPPAEFAERRLWSYLFGTKFEPLYDNGVLLTDNGQPLYEVKNA